MAEDTTPVVGIKRGPGRPPKGSTPVTKRRKLDTAEAPRLVQDPAPQSMTARSKPSPHLPLKLSSQRPLPVLAEPQPAQLPDDEYQSIASSAVLQASLARSQRRWTVDGLFEKYWTKPETGKNARPPPKDNPDVKWMKAKGECRIRIEPHIFECQMYVEEKPRPPPPPKPYTAPASTPYGQPYRQQPYGGPPYQNPNLPPIQHMPGQQGQLLPHMNSITPRLPLVPPPAPRTQPPPTDKKSPDPVISKLAARAASDPELKSLMKEVANGSATPGQLKIFQTHIDELQKQIREERAEKERQEAEAERKRAEAIAAREEAVQYDGSSDRKPAVGAHGQFQPGSFQAGASQPYAAPQPWTAPPPTEKPVILSFNVPGATEDRFLFPQYSILETLSPHHHLASFIITRKGKDAADPTGLDPDVEYWQPVTLMLEVKTGLETALPEHVKRWVKPADVVRKHMEDIMKRCQRAPEGWLALRLPFKGSEKVESDVSTANVSKEASPAGTVREEKNKSRSNIKYVRKPTSVLKTALSASSRKMSNASDKTPMSEAKGASEPKPELNGEAGQVGETAASNTEPATTESGRPKRTMRKSVRISEV